jgi:hypothetical protein
MATGGFFSSNLYSLHNIVQNTQVLYPKELLISTMREYFAKDSKYHYVEDEWGFPKTPDHTDLNPRAGLQDDLTTRIYIGQENRFDIKFYPAVLVKNTSCSSYNISMNQEEECLEYAFTYFEDAYGNNTFLKTPVNFVFAGAWDLGFDIDILTEGPQDRTTLFEAISMLFQHIKRKDLTVDGLFIKKISGGGESYELYQNDNIYKQTISLECYGEWRKLVPITNLIEVITACIEIGHYDNSNNFNPDPNLQINWQLDLSNTILQTESI